MVPVIQVQHAYKKYSRNANVHLNYGLGDLYNHLLGRRPSLELRKDEFYAVEDVSFELERGESFALIGRNGSGKTTLLKIMNGLSKLDSGRIVMDGRIQALINLGAGFNPNLSGIDNIYNSAALMGFNRRQTAKIVDEIIDFSELEEFIESPVQTYSSGMRARLGFAVAVQLDPDILLIDEILAVGDHAFQNKCHIKMQALKKKGVTIVLVSHAHTQVTQLCDNALWMHKGKMMHLGPAKQTVSKYLSFLEEQEKKHLDKNLPEPTHKKAVKASIKKETKEVGVYGPMHPGPEYVDNISVKMLVKGRENHAFPVHSAVTIEYEFRLKMDVSDLNVTLGFFGKDGRRMSGISTLNGDLLKSVRNGWVRARVKIPDFNLAPGQYVLILPIHEGHSYLHRSIVKEFMVLNNDRMTWGDVDFTYSYEVY